MIDFIFGKVSLFTYINLILLVKKKTLDLFEKLVSLGSFSFKSESNVTASNNFTHVNQKHLEGVLRKRYSENIQHIFRRTPVPKDDLNKIALQLY